MVSVVTRARASVTGIYETVGAREHVLPDPELFGSPIELVPGAVQPRDGEIVDVEIVEYPEGRRPAVGRIVEILGVPGELGTLVETVIRRHGLPRRFPDDALEDAASLPETLTDDDVAGRRDLRGETLFTIDGADARDFDDAVGVLPSESGGWRLLVSIADVSHWAPRGSALDREALERGTSTYFPDRVIPMLPERLSNGLASLRPGEDRLTLTAEIHFDRTGRRERAKVYESVIRSAGRWTYEGRGASPRRRDGGRRQRAPRSGPSHARPHASAPRAPPGSRLARLRSAPSPTSCSTPAASRRTWRGPSATMRTA